jgi:hypothetical protein
MSESEKPTEELDAWDSFTNVDHLMDSGKQKQSEVLLDLCAKRGVSTFRDLESGSVLARFPREGHWEVYPANSRIFASWLVREAYGEQGTMTGKGALDDAIRFLEAEAFGAPSVRTFVRIARSGERVFVDLCNEEWRVVEIDQCGWRVVVSDDIPVFFRRSSTTLPLPDPERGGSLSDLRRFVNAKTDEDFVLAACWLVAATNAEGPFPILLLSSEHGTGKSSTAKALKEILDPEATSKRSAPRDEDAIITAASNHWILAYDNLSSVKGDLSDTLCRIATGGGLSKRALYTDCDEFTFFATRPVIVNGIGVSFERPDLMNRTLVVELKPIPEEARKTERELEAAFREAHPRILGAVCDAISAALREKEYRPERLPRMADASAWVLQAERGGGLPWNAGTFASVLDRATREMEEAAIAENPLAQKLFELSELLGGWKGTVRDLRRLLTEGTPFEERSTFPRTDRGLGQAVTRLLPLLRSRGIEIERARTRAGIVLSIRTVNVEREHVNVGVSNVHTPNADEHYIGERVNVVNVVSDRQVEGINPNPIVEQPHATDSDSFSSTGSSDFASQHAHVHASSDCKASEREHPCERSKQRSQFALPEPPFLARGHWGEAWVDSVEFDENGEAWFIFGQGEEKRQERANESEVKIGSRWTDAA